MRYDAESRDDLSRGEPEEIHFFTLCYDFLLVKKKKKVKRTYFHSVTVTTNYSNSVEYTEI